MPLFSSDSSEAVVVLPTIFSLVCHDANNWTTSIKSEAETRYMNKASIQNTPVNMLVGSKILVHAMPIFYLQIYKNNDVACGPNFMLDEFSGNPLYFQSPLGEELNHPLLCLLLPLQQARRSTTGSGDKKSVSKWSIRYVY